MKNTILHIVSRETVSRHLGHRMSMSMDRSMLCERGAPHRIERSM